MPVKNAIGKNWGAWVRGSDGVLRSDDPTGASGRTPAITSLPSISASAPQFLTTAQLAAIDIYNQAYAATFSDPISNVNYTRVTDATHPVANTGCFFDYVEGGPWVSGEWGVGNHTIFYVVRTPSFVCYLIDYNRNTKALSNSRSVAFGQDQRFAFSMVSTTPRIAYYITGASPGVLNRYNTATDALANTGFFPKTFTASTTPNWLQTDKDDRMFICMDQGGTNVVRSWDSSTDTAVNHTFAGLDEPHMERNGVYAAVITGTNAICWNISADTVSNVGTTASFFHACHLRNGWISPYTGGSAPFVDNYFTPKGVGVAFDPQATLSGGATSPNVHFSGHWVQSVSTDQQYALAFTYGHGAAGGFAEAHANHDGTIDCYYNTQLAHDSAVYRRADGGDNRYLCTLFTRWANDSTITGITKAASAVFTVSRTDVVNPYAVGSQVDISGVGGMTQMNGLTVTVTAIGGSAGAWTFTTSTDSSAFSVYTSGGTASTSARDYYAIMGGTSPDGKVAVFSTNMQRAGGRTDVFIVNVPLA